MGIFALLFLSHHKLTLLTIDPSPTTVISSYTFNERKPGNSGSNLFGQSLVSRVHSPNSQAGLSAVNFAYTALTHGFRYSLEEERFHTCVLFIDSITTEWSAGSNQSFKVRK